MGEVSADHLVMSLLKAFQHRSSILRCARRPRARPVRQSIQPPATPLWFSTVHMHVFHTQQHNACLWLDRPVVSTATEASLNLCQNVLHLLHSGQTQNEGQQLRTPLFALECVCAQVMRNYRMAGMEDGQVLVPATGSSQFLGSLQSPTNALPAFGAATTNYQRSTTRGPPK